MKLKQKFKRTFSSALLVSLCTAMTCGTTVSAAEDKSKNNIGVKLADYVIKQYKDPDTITSKQWEYTNGIVFAGMEKIYENTKDSKYLDYTRSWVDKYVDSTGNISPIRSGHSLDIIQPSELLFTLAENSSDPRYKLCATLTRNKYNDFPVNAEGGFWHKTNYPNQMWLDGTYMGMPFIAEYGNKFATKGADRDFCYSTAANQLKLVAKHTMDPKTKLCYHAWSQDKSAAWANSETGRSPEFWSRAMGWYAMALVDTLEYLPKDSDEYKDLKKILRDVAAGIKKVQDPDTGLWYQVLDKGDQSDNWLETSGSAMFVYALKKAAVKGYIDSSYNDVAAKGWKGVKSKISFTADGNVVVKDTAQAMGVQVDYNNYVNKEKVDNLPHGIAAVLMAASEMEK